jgi:hypothetical protein
MTRHIIIFSFVIVCLISCSTTSNKKELKPNLYADREAPIGWTHFKTYPDSTFEYYSSARDINNGTFRMRGDSLYLTFADTTNIWDIAVVDDGRVKFVDIQDTNFKNTATINFNTLTKPKH